MNENGVVFKCKKCRIFLFTGKSVVNCHSVAVTSTDNGTVCGPITVNGEKNVWYLSDDKLEDWINEQVNLGEWVKGKLTCPKCSSRLGCFDFVTGKLCPCGQRALPAVHIVKSKVDAPFIDIKEIVVEKKMDLQPTGPSLVTTPPPPPPPPAATISDITSVTMSDLNRREEAETSSTIVFRRDDEPTNLNQSDDSLNRFEDYDDDSTTGKNNLMENTKSETADSMVSLKNAICSSDVEEKMEAEMNQCLISSMAAIRSSLTCPVCLDIFFSPFSCKPCEHIFCESCLRRVAKSCPTKTSCPLCRQLVVSCEINHGYDKSVKLYFTDEAKLKVREDEIRLLKLTSPLPWMPNNYRNGRYYNGSSSSNQQPSLLEMIQSLPTNMWTSFCLSLPTIALLFFLHVVCIATFSLSYLGFSYIPSILVHWILALFKAVGVLSPAYEKEINIPALTPAWYATAVAIAISVVVWQKVRSN